MKILNNIILLRDDLLKKGWCITAFDFVYKEIKYIVIFELLDKQLLKNKYYIAQLKFINTNDDSELITLVNSVGFNVSISTIRKFFNVNYVENLGDFLTQFYTYFAKFIPSSFIMPNKEHKEYIIDTLNNKDHDNNIYCYAIKRNGKSANGKQYFRTIFNDNKTRLLRPILYDHFINDRTISFCYKPLLIDEKDDNTIIMNFTKHHNN